MNVKELKEWLLQFPEDFEVKVIIDNENTVDGGEYLSFEGNEDCDYSVTKKTLYLGN